MKTERSQQIINLLNGRLGRFDNTRNIQWKINTSLWTGMVLVIGYLKFETVDTFCCWGIITVSALICIAHGITVFNIQSSLNWDKKIITKYHKLIDNDLETPQEIVTLINKAEKEGDKKRYWFIIQIATTITISIIGILILCNCKC